MMADAAFFVRNIVENYKLKPGANIVAYSRPMLLPKFSRILRASNYQLRDSIACVSSENRNRTHVALIAQAPLDGNYANNALLHGVAGLNIDGTRLPTKDSLNGGAYSGGQSSQSRASTFVTAAIDYGLFYSARSCCRNGLGVA